MSADTQLLVQICSQLSEAKRTEVIDFARFLLASSNPAAPIEAADRWLATAGGAAKPGVTTDQAMALTRGEP